MICRIPEKQLIEKYREVLRRKSILADNKEDYPTTFYDRLAYIHGIMDTIEWINGERKDL